MKYLCISVFILECISVRGGMSIECIFNEVYVLHFWMAFVPLSGRFHYYCSQSLVSVCEDKCQKSKGKGSRIMWRLV